MLHFMLVNIGHRGQFCLITPLSGKGSHALSYFCIQRGFSNQPDIQYIIRPGWFGQANNALVLGLQIAGEL
jgi:hypothetical protein